MKVDCMIDATILLLFLIGLEPDLTGGAVHEWLNLVFAVAVIAHLVRHWDWMAAILGHPLRQRSPGARLNSVIDMLLALTFVLLVLSGLMMSRSILRLPESQVPGHSLWRELHSVLSNLILFLIGVHFAVHWDWVTRAWIRHVGGALKYRSRTGAIQG